MVAACVTGFGVALPRVVRQDRLWEEFFAAHYAHDEKAERLWRRAGVVTRHGVVDPREEDISGWGTGARMRRFVQEALPLGKEAVAAALHDAGLVSEDVDQLTVVSCTGYTTPGLDILLARDLGLPSDVQRLHVGHMGCYAALPALSGLADTVTARGGVGVLLCIELTSLHIQPPSDELDQVVAHALFSDAAAATVLQPGGGGLEVVDVVAHTDVERAALMTWDVTDLGFRMGLSPQVPDVLEACVADVVGELLAGQGLDVADVAGWALHPGGPRIIDVVAAQLGLPDAALADSRAVLADHGNCSSPTVLLVLERLVAAGLEAGEHVVAIAFGPGLTLYAVLLRQR